MLTKTGEIRRDEGCIDYAGQYVMVYPCHGMRGNQEWVYGKVCHCSLFIFICDQWRNYNFCLPPPANVRYRLTVLIQ